VTTSVSVDGWAVVTCNYIGLLIIPYRVDGRVFELMVDDLAPDWRFDGVRGSDRVRWANWRSINFVG
jgi:hypothetical protein